MSSLNALDAIIFSPSADDLTVVAGGDVVLATTITAADGSTVFDNTSTYSPGDDGLVHLAELSELVNAAVLLSLKPSAMLTAGVRTASCQLSILATVGTLRQQKQCRALYMWRDITEIKPMFATQVRRRRFLEGVPQPVSVLTAGMTGLKLVIGAAYRTSGGLQWQEATVQPDCSGDYFTLLADPDSIRLATSAPDSSTLLYYALTLYDLDNRQLDCIRFDPDRQTRPSAATHFVYYNLFGVPECITFRGKSEEQQELDSDFGYAGRDYVRLNAAVTESHKANSGWLTREERHAAYDFMASPCACVYTGGSLHRIAITELDSSISRPTSEPDSVSLTWRMADERLMRTPCVAPDTGSSPIFAKPPFDKTFD